MKILNMNILNRSEEGFTLIEVLVAIVIFSFGLLGIAGMLTISVRNNHNGYLRSQANFLAENIADRMRANQVALWAEDFNGDASTGSSVCDLGTPCTYADLAAYEVEQWAQSLSLLLPSGEGNIDCVTVGAAPVLVNIVSPPSIWSPVPPYDGICTVTITWNESNETGVNDEQSLVLVIQP